MTTPTLNETARRILSEVQPIDDADVLADVVIRADITLLNDAWKLMGRSLTADEKRRLLNAVAAQWGGR